MEVSVKYDVGVKEAPPPSRSVRVLQQQSVRLPGAQKTLCVRYATPCFQQHACQGYHNAAWHLAALRGSTLIEVHFGAVRQGDQPWPPFAQSKPVPEHVARRQVALMFDLAHAFLLQKGTIYTHETLDLEMHAVVNGKRSLLIARDRVSTRTPTRCRGNAYALEAERGDQLAFDFSVTSTRTDLTVDRLTTSSKGPCAHCIIELHDVEWPRVSGSCQGFRWTADERGEAHLRWGRLTLLGAKRLRIYPVVYESVWAATRASKPVEAMLFIRNGRPVETYLDAGKLPAVAAPEMTESAVAKAVLSQYDRLYDPDFNDFRGGRESPKISKTESFFLKRASQVVPGSFVSSRLASHFLGYRDEGSAELLALRYFGTRGTQYLEPLLRSLRRRKRQPPKERMSVTGDPKGEWGSTEVQKLLLLHRVAAAEDDSELRAEAALGTRRVAEAMKAAFNPTHYDPGKAWLGKTIDSEEEWEGHAWSALMFWEAHRAKGDAHHRDMAVAHARHLLQRHKEHLTCALSYHAIRRTAEETGSEEFRAAARNTRAAMLERWERNCTSRAWLLDCLRMFGDRSIPYEGPRDSQPK